MASRLSIALMFIMIAGGVCAGSLELALEKSAKELQLIDGVKAGDYASVEQLLKAGVDPDAKVMVNHPQPVEFPQTPLYWAIKRQDPKLVALLLAHGANANGKLEGDSLLTYAAFIGCAQCVAPLVEAGADVNRRNGFGKTTLMLAASQGWADVVQFLILQGADINAKTGYTTGDTALTYAKVRKHPEVVKILEAAGAQ